MPLSGSRQQQQTDRLPTSSGTSDDVEHDQQQLLLRGHALSDAVGDGLRATAATTGRSTQHGAVLDRLLPKARGFSQLQQQESASEPPQQQQQGREHGNHRCDCYDVMSHGVVEVVCWRVEGGGVGREKEGMGGEGVNDLKERDRTNTAALVPLTETSSQLGQGCGASVWSYTPWQQQSKESGPYGGSMLHGHFRQTTMALPTRVEPGEPHKL
jgi:hypothetical protein